MENDRSTVAEVNRVFCKNALVVGAIIKLEQFIIALKLEMDNRFFDVSLNYAGFIVELHIF